MVGSPRATREGERTMHEEAYKQIQAAASQGPNAIFAAAENAALQTGDYHRLFDFLVLHARHELGLPLFLMGSVAELTLDAQKLYEERVLEAGRRIRDLFLQKGDVPTAFRYAKMIGETEPIQKALAVAEPPAEEHLDAWIDVAVSHGVFPRRGLEWIVERYGICQGITSCEQILAQETPSKDRIECISYLVRCLHAELTLRLAEAVSAREGSAPQTLPALIANRHWLFSDDAYFVDVSHLHSVVRFARFLPKCEELFLALQLCEYGQRLSPKFRYAEPPPFEDVFQSTAAFLKISAGVEVEKNLEYFRSKAASAPASMQTEANSLEVYLHLLTILDRGDAALKLAAAKLNQDEYRPTLGLTVNELCQKFGRFKEMAEMARLRDDPLGFVAGVVQQAGSVPITRRP